MVKHIVFWKLKEEAEGNTKEANKMIMKEKLEALMGKIPGLTKIEVGFDFLESPASFDVALYSEFPTREDLEVYRVHPEHVAVAGFVGKVTSERAVVDYDI